MTTFSYQAVNREGKQVRGELAASDRGRAHAQLVAQGLQPFLLEAGKEGSASSRSETKKERAAPASGKRGGTLRLSDKERLAFTEELCDLLTAGLTLEQALRSMEKREGKAGRKPIAGTVRTKVEEGMTLAQSLRQTSASFGDLYCNLVLAGEQSASLGIILQRQRRYLQTIQELRSRISSSMIYPAFLLISSLGVTVIFITFLIPKLTTLMEATDSTPPLPAIVLM
ncbi:MAG: type II secretion system F family protein, partial [Verrucomicrobiota bacterium]